jgi:hypothetical protein
VSFIHAWKENYGNWKDRLTDEEVAEFESAIEKMKSFDSFNDKMTKLFGPQRHKAIRETRTFQYVQECVHDFLSTEGNTPADLIFGDTETVLKNFKAKFVIDEKRNHLLGAMKDCDLHYLAAILAYEATGCPPFTCVFGVREKYHHALPDAMTAGAEWQSLIFDKVRLNWVVLLAGMSAIKQGKRPHPQYFRMMLDSEEKNAFQEEPWREIAEILAGMDEVMFYDQLDRAFNGIQYDSKVTKLTTRFERDIYYRPNYFEDKLFEYKGCKPYERQHRSV